MPLRVLKSALDESRIAREVCGVDVPVIILDDSRDAGVSAHNLAVCRGAGAERPDTTVYFLPRPLQRQLAGDIARMTGVELGLLFGEGKAYGRMFNMLFAMGRILGLRFYHRRDSDVYTQMVDGAPLAPIEIELRYIGTERDGSTIRIVGGNYVGEPNLRLDDCMKNETFADNLIASWTTTGHDEQTRRALVALLRNSYAYDGDTITVGALQSPAYVDGGNVCFDGDIYALIPNSPVEELTGTDYCMFYLAAALREGVLVHNRRLVHDHSEERVQPEDMARYWEAMFYNADSVVYHRAFAAIESAADQLKRSATYAFDVLSAFIEALRVAYRSDHAARLVCLARLADALISTGATPYREIGERFARTGYSGVLEAVARNAETYILLLQRWRDILACLTELAPRYADLLHGRSRL